MKVPSDDSAAQFAAELNDILRRHHQNLDQLVSRFAGVPERLAAMVAELTEESREFALRCHRMKMDFDWTIPPTPEWFDHYLDQYFQLPNSHNTYWFERGVFGGLAVKRGGRLLEICCGDGFNSRHFYSPLVAEMIAADFDPDAIAHARRYNGAPNVEFMETDIREAMPQGVFDNVVWDAAIEHFTEEEIDKVISEIRRRLVPGGILSGYTIVECSTGKHIPQHEREFRDKEDLANFLTPHFENVRVFETTHPSRHNLYFWASDGLLPFDPEWENGLRVRGRGAG